MVGCHWFPVLCADRKPVLYEVANAYSGKSGDCGSSSTRFNYDVAGITAYAVFQNYRPSDFII